MAADQAEVLHAAEVILDAVFVATVEGRSDDELVNPALALRMIRDAIDMPEGVAVITDEDVDAGWMTVREAKQRHRSAYASLASGEPIR